MRLREQLERLVVRDIVVGLYVRIHRPHHSRTCRGCPTMAVAGFAIEVAAVCYQGAMI